MSIAKSQFTSHNQLGSLSGSSADSQRKQCHAVLRGVAIVVENRHDIVYLVQLGCFGKGSLSRSIPLELDRGEVLHLLYEEAMYLCSLQGLHCLSVSEADSNNVLGEEQLWLALIKLSASFPVNYAAYCCLRKSNWTPKSGLKFGADFAVYLKGPSFYHARYSVIVIDNRQCRKEQRGSSWSNAHCLMRTSHQVVKQTMLLYVSSDIDNAASVSEQEWLHSTQIVCRIMKRWIPETDRELCTVQT